MPKAIKIYAISPEKDYRAIEYFFSHLDAFQKHKEQILQCEDLYRIPIAGMGICGLFLGECSACLGELMLLYQDAWKFNQGEDTRYLIHMAGSPLSGMNSCSFWSTAERICPFLTKTDTLWRVRALNRWIYPLCKWRKSTAFLLT